MCGGDRGVFTLLRRAEVFHTALTPGTELWLKPRHTPGASVCVFEENRECVSGVIVWCVCQHVVSVSTLEMHMFICAEDSSFFIPFKLMCFCMFSEVYEFKSLLFFIFLDQRCQKLVTVWKQSFLSLQLSVVIWKAQCRALVAYLHYCSVCLSSFSLALSLFRQSPVWVRSDVVLPGGAALVVLQEQPACPR